MSGDNPSSWVGDPLPGGVVGEGDSVEKVSEREDREEEASESRLRLVFRLCL